MSRLGGSWPRPGVAAHLGELHTYEQWLVLLVAFGPFVVLAGIVVVLRRRDLTSERAHGQAGGSASQDAPT